MRFLVSAGASGGDGDGLRFLVRTSLTTSLGSGLVPVWLYSLWSSVASLALVVKGSWGRTGVTAAGGVVVETVAVEVEVVTAAGGVEVVTAAGGVEVVTAAGGVEVVIAAGRVEAAPGAAAAVVVGRAVSAGIDGGVLATCRAAPAGTGRVVPATGRVASAGLGACANCICRISSDTTCQGYDMLVGCGAGAGVAKVELELLPTGCSVAAHAGFAASNSARRPMRSAFLPARGQPRLRSSSRSSTTVFLFQSVMVRDVGIGVLRWIRFAHGAPEYRLGGTRNRNAEGRRGRECKNARIGREKIEE